MKARLIAGVLVLTVMVGLVGCGKNDNVSMNNSDRDFMDRMAYLHNSEVQLGNLAIAKTSDSTIQAFGQMMVTDHSTAMKELMILAKERSYRIPSGPDADHMTLKVVLEAQVGRKFDSIYVRGQFNDHVVALEMIEEVLSKGIDQALRKYATKYKPIAEMHKDTAEVIIDRMGF